MCEPFNPYNFEFKLAYPESYIHNIPMSKILSIELQNTALLPPKPHHKFIPKEIFFYLFKICEERKYSVTTKFQSTQVLSTFITLLEKNHTHPHPQPQPKTPANNPKRLNPTQPSLITQTADINLQLYALTSLFLISKLHEYQPLTLTDLHFYSEQNFTRRNFLEAENEILYSLDFDLLSLPTSIPEMICL
jgi:hypothetical protein